MSALIFGIIFAAAATPAAAQQAEYPCLRSVFAPASASQAEEGKGNAQALGAELAAEYRRFFTPARIFDVDAIYNESLWVRDDAPALRRDMDSGGRLSYEQVLTHGLFPAFHADLIAALADEFEALDYRTVTPTCLSQYQQQGPDEYFGSHFVTLFLMPDGTIAYLRYSHNRELEYTRKEFLASLKGQVRVDGGYSAKLMLVALPVYPFFQKFFEGIPKNEPLRTKQLRDYASLTGLTTEQVLEIYALRDSIEWQRYLRLSDCRKQMPQFREKITRDSNLVRCLYGPVVRYGKVDVGFAMPEDEDEVERRLATFILSTRVDQLTTGTERLWSSLFDEKARQTEQEERDRVNRMEAAARRRADTAAISSGIAMGLQSVVASNAAENRRAAAAANARFSAQYGCAAGACSDVGRARGEYDATLSAKEIVSGDRRSGGSANDAPPVTPYTPPASGGGDVETKQGVTSVWTGYRNGQPLRSDADMCSNLEPSTVGKVIQSTVSACTCEDKNMGSRTRVCKVTFDYTIGVDPKTEKRSSER